MGHGEASGADGTGEACLAHVRRPDGSRRMVSSGYVIGVPLT